MRAFGGSTSELGGLLPGCQVQQLGNWLCAIDAQNATTRRKALEPVVVQTSASDPQSATVVRTRPRDERLVLPVQVATRLETNCTKTLSFALADALDQSAGRCSRVAYASSQSSPKPANWQLEHAQSAADQGRASSSRHRA